MTFVWLSRISTLSHSNRSVIISEIWFARLTWEGGKAMKDDLSESWNPPMVTIWLAKVQSITLRHILLYIFLTKNANHEWVPAYAYIYKYTYQWNDFEREQEDSNTVEKNMTKIYMRPLHTSRHNWLVFIYIAKLNFVFILLSRVYKFAFQTQFLLFVPEFYTLQFNIFFIISNATNLFIKLVMFTSTFHK